jgi:hypothetical protein
MIKNKVSVVIPSLGGDVLIRTIRALNSGTLIPHEILIVVPKNNNLGTPPLNYQNIRFILSQSRGQVPQRAEGFKRSVCEYVLQLDDDVILDGNCLKSLLEGIRERSAIGPIMYYYDSRASVYTYRPNLLINIKDYLVHGFKFGKRKMGTISKSVVPFGYDPKVYDKTITDTEWLAGGCILHNRANLILTDYYSFKGKAYCEDLIHSTLLRQNKITLLVQKNAKCYIENIEATNYSLINDFNAKIKFNRLNNRGNNYLYLWFLLKKVGG